MPQDELFNMVTGYEPGQYAFSRSCNGVARSDAAVVVEITLRRGRSDAMKRDLYAAIARHLQAMAQVAPADAVAGLLRVIDAATPAQSGSFLDWRGEALPW